MGKELSKPVNYAIFYIIKHAIEKGKFVIVQRPRDDENLPDLWGIPAGSVMPNESFEDSVIRQAKNKLGVDVKIVEFIGRGNIDRGEYILHGEEYLVEIIEGDLSVNRPEVQGTKYQDWKWGTAEDIKETAQKGSLCCNIYLEEKAEGFLVKYTK